MESKRNAISNRCFDFNLCGSRSVAMTLNKDAIYTVRGYGENGRPKLSCEAKGYQQMTIAVRAYSSAGCRSIDIDVLEKPAE